MLPEPSLIRGKSASSDQIGLVGFSFSFLFCPLFRTIWHLWFAKTPADREINNMACHHLTAVLL